MYILYRYVHYSTNKSDINFTLIISYILYAMMFLTSQTANEVAFKKSVESTLF